MQRTAPTLGVIVPVYNRPELVARMLGSLMSQTRKPDELILVDNASTDGTLGVLKRFKETLPTDERMRVKILEETKSGSTQAREKGLEHSTTDYVLFFDSDDMMRPGHIERVYRMMGSGKDILVWPILTHRLSGKVKERPLPSKNAMENHQLHTMLSTQGYAIKREYLLEQGGWNRDLHCWNDLELGHRLLLSHPSIETDKEIEVDVYEQGKESITGEGYSHRRGEWEHVIDLMEEETLTSTTITEGERMHTMRLLAYRRLILGALYAREGNREAATENREKALASRCLTALQRAYLRIAYQVTSRGIPGAARLVPLFFPAPH